MLVRIGVCTDTDTFGSDDHRRPVLHGVLTCCLHGVHRVEDILPITEERLEMAYTGVVLPDTWISRLLMRRYGDAVAVALQDEDHRQALTSCPIDRLEDIAFGGRRFAVRSDSHPIDAIVVQGTCQPDGLCIMRRYTGGDIMDPPVYLGVMIRHVTSATSRVRSLRDPIEDHLLHGHPSGECS